MESLADGVFGFCPIYWSMQVYDHAIAAAYIQDFPKLVATAVFFALVIDGMDFQMLALFLPVISKELHLFSINAGALSTYTLIGMGVGGGLAGWLADCIGCVRVVWWSVLTFSTFTAVVAACRSHSPFRPFASFQDLESVRYTVSGRC